MNASSGAASGRCNGCSIMSRSIRAGAWSMRPTRRRRNRPARGERRGGRAVPDHRGQSRRRHLQCAGVSRSRRRVRHWLGFQRADRRQRRIAAARIFAAAGASGAKRHGGDSGVSTGRTLFESALQGRIAGSRRRDLGPDGGRASPISSALMRSDVALAGRAGDAILDSWIFGAGRSLVDCVWARGRKVVKDGRHHARETRRAALSSNAAKDCWPHDLETQARRAGRRRSISGSAAISKPVSCPATGRRGIVCRSNTN